MDNNKKIDEFIEAKLRSSGSGYSLSGDFGKNLMVRIREEHALARQEMRQNKLVKYFIGGFCSFVIGLTVLLGLLSGSKAPATSSGKFNIEPTIETSNNYLNRFFGYMGDVFNKAMELLGLTTSSRTVELVVALLIAFVLFMLADKIFVRGRLRTNKL